MFRTKYRWLSSESVHVFYESLKFILEQFFFSRIENYLNFRPRHPTKKFNSKELVFFPSKRFHLEILHHE